MLSAPPLSALRGTALSMPAMASGKKALSMPYFNYSPGQNGADFVYTVPDVGLGAVGVMDVAGAMPDIKHLAGLVRVQNSG